MIERIERKCHGLTWEAQDTPRVRVWEAQTSLPAYVVEYRKTGGFLGGGVLEPTFEDACASEVESKLRTAKRIIDAFSSYESKLRTAKRIIDAFSSYERTEEHD